MTLGAMDAEMGAWELQLWAAKAQIESAVQQRQSRAKGLTYSQALDLVRSDHRATMARKGKTWP